MRELTAIRGAYADAYYLKYVPGGLGATGTYIVIEASRTGSCNNTLASPSCPNGDLLSYTGSVRPAALH